MSETDIEEKDEAPQRPVEEPGFVPDTSQPPYGWALAVAGAVFALYALTLAPTTAFWDTSEYIATSHILGIPHPPGNPLFVVLARTWEILLAPLGLSVAVRINLFSAFMSAVAHGLWFLVIHHVLRYFSTDRRFRLGGAAVAVLVSATAFTVWNQSNVNEKVYTVSLMTIALLTWLAFRWQENLGKGKDDNLLVLMAFILALSVGNHLMAFLAAPAIFVFVVMVRPATLLNWKLYPAILAAGIVGLSIHLFLPIRAGLDPIINEAAPTCESITGALQSIVTYGKSGCVALSEALQRRQYEKPSMLALPWNPELPRTIELFGSQLLNYLQYFDWQWSRSLAGENTLFADVRIPFTMLFTGLGVWGAIEHHRRDKPSFYYVLVLFGTLSLALVFYLNFKYGYSIPDPYGDITLHEVRERDYFFIVSFSVWGLWAGVGIAALWRWLADEVAGGLWKASPILGLAFIPLALNWSWADRSYDWAARDWAYNLLQSVEPYGILFTNGDNDTFPLWYIQEVEGVRQDVTVIVTSYLNTPWYARQLQGLTSPCPEGVSAKDDPTLIICQREYEPGDGPAYVGPGEGGGGTEVVMETDEPIRTPELSILTIDDETLERIAGSYFPLDQGRTVQLGPVQANLPGGTYLYPWHQYALSIISTGLQDGRPIYFASSGSAASSLGLRQHVYRQGLAFRLHEGSLEEEPPPGVIRLTPGSAVASIAGAWVDAPRTETLMEDVFVHRGGIPDWDHWPDISTLGIPNYYSWGYYALAQVAFQENDSTELGRWSEKANAWSDLGN